MASSNNSAPDRIRILYVVHDTADAAVARRLEMLLDAGADVVVAGFRRSAEQVAMINGIEPIDLGQTFDARMAHRAARVLNAALSLGRHAARIGKVDVIIARNLESLLLAARCQASFLRNVPIAYECLDIHSSLIKGSGSGQLLRALERSLMRRCGLLIVSSPAFVSEYFVKRQGLRLKVLLLENKAAPSAVQALEPIEARAPWTIGWFGIIRCARSFEFLAALAAARPGFIKVLIAGRPTSAVFPTFDALVANSPGVEFVGAYKQDELPNLYGAVHFTWAVDCYEQGANSSWLLPNRLYEGTANGAVPIALRHVETGRWLISRQMGLVVDDFKEASQALSKMTPERFVELRSVLIDASRDDLVLSSKDGYDLINSLKELARKPGVIAEHDGFPDV